MMKMSVKNTYSRYFTLLSVLLSLLLLSTSVVPVSAYSPTYPSLILGDYDIAYDEGEVGGGGFFIDSDGASIRVLYTPSVNGLLHEVRIIWSYTTYSEYVRLVIEDADTLMKKTSAPIQVSSSSTASWQVIDVSSLAFVTSGDFYVYIQYDSGGVPSGDRHYISVHDDDDQVIDYPGRFQWTDGVSAWANRWEMCIRAVITRLPNQVIPEVPYGTITAMALLLLGFAIYIKRPF